MRVEPIRRSTDVTRVHELMAPWVEATPDAPALADAHDRFGEAIDAAGWLSTGDIARRDPDGALHIVGRSKELIIHSGFNVYPVEVEQVLNSCRGVVQSAVVGRSDAHNEDVIAFVEAAAGAGLDEAALKAYARERLSPCKVPAEIRFLPQLPAAPTGKILKSALVALARTPADVAASRASGSTP